MIGNNTKLPCFYDPSSLNLAIVKTAVCEETPKIDNVSQLY